MGRKTWIITTFLVLSAALQYWVHAQNRPSRSVENLERGAAAPALPAADMDGQPVALSSLRGKFVVLDFWASWCPPCQVEFSDLEAWWTRESAAGLLDDVVVLAVNAGESKNEVRRYQDERKLPFRIVLDESRALLRTYHVQALPTLILIDREGNVVWTQTGYDNNLGARLNSSLRAGHKQGTPAEKS